MRKTNKHTRKKKTQSQTPNHIGGGNPYKVDGECVEQCDCGPVNPCGEYIFDHRGGEVDGRSFTEWFVNEYMISNETLLHKDPVTGKPQPIGLGWLDDSMSGKGPSEEDRNYIADTNASGTDMQSQVGAYKASMQALRNKVLPMGGYWMQLMGSPGNPVGPNEKGFPHSNVPIPPRTVQKQPSRILRRGESVGDAALLEPVDAVWPSGPDQEVIHQCTKHDRLHRRLPAHPGAVCNDRLLVAGMQQWANAHEDATRVVRRLWGSR